MPQPTSHDSFLPDFCDIRMVFAVVVTTELLAVVITLGGGDTLATFWSDLSLKSLYAQWIALSAAALLCVLGPLLRRLDHTRSGVAAWAVIQAASVVASIAAWSLYPRSGAREYGAFLAQSLGISAIVGAVILRYLYEQYRKRQRELAASKARFAMLQARIRPHFLFNSMNTIASLTRKKPAMAEEIVQDLSDLFRASLAGDERLSTLDEELALARGYLRIEQQRLGTRLKVQWDLESLPPAARVPQLVLQPLLENAVYHGIEPSTDGGEIVVSGRHRRGTINLSVRNSLPPAHKRSTREGNQMAMGNVRDRLLAAFGDAAGVTVGEVEGQYQVRMHFPYEKALQERGAMP